MAYCLHIDTSGDGGQLGLSLEGQLIQKSGRVPPREQGAQMTRQIHEVLDKAGLPIHVLKYICLCSGPGSYTGLRVGYATAKALSYVLKIPLMALSRLELLSLSSQADMPSALWLEAREKEYFFARYDPHHQPIRPPVHLTEDAFLEEVGQLGKETWTRGIIPSHLGPAFDRMNLNPPLENLDIDFNLWAHFSYQSYLSKRFVDLGLSEPEYLKQVFLRNLG